MLKSLVKALGFALYERKRSVGLIAGLAFSGAAFALGMGGISVITGLGEPLKADIELVAVSNAEKNSLSARLASPEVFKSAGMDYPTGIPQLKFKIETRAEGGNYIRVTSVDPLNEPFVSILVELNWPSGKLLREYTFLLDPPGFKPELIKEAEVQPVVPSAPSASVTPEPQPATVKSEAAPIRATAPMDEKVFAAAAKKSVPSGEIADGTIKVIRGDTLGKIANKMKPADVSLERMLVALYRANADVFDGKNMNRLKAGKILRMPDQSELSNLNQTDSVKEIHAQAADWNAYRQKLAAASVAVTEQAHKQEASGKISTTVADKAPATQESAKEVVRLSKGESPSDKTAGAGKAKALQDKAHQEEEAIAKSKALKESGERIAMLEKNTKAMQRLIELKSQSVAKPEAQKEVKPESPAPVVAFSAVAPASAIEPASAVTSASAVQPAKPAGKKVAKPNPVAPPPPPSLLDEVLGEPLYLAGGAAALLALGGLALARRRKTAVSAGAQTEDVDGATGRILAPAAPSPETGDFTGGAASSVEANVAATDEVDPISEADLFLNFGRDVQAEDILKDALGRNPANLKVVLKLMSIYANRKDINSFSSYASQVKDSGDATAWEQAAEMGRKLEPNNPMYSGGEVGEPEIHAVPDAAKSEPPAPVVDFDLGLGTHEVASMPGAPSGEKTEIVPQVDFDLGFEEPITPLSETTMAMSPGESHQSEAGSLDFDVTSTNPGLSVPDMNPAASASESVGKEGDFMLDFPIDDKPVGDKTEAAPAQVEIRKSMDIDLSDINLGLGEPAAPLAAPVAEVRDANWNDVATKLDLAKAYQEMGDAAGAREILAEVVREGDTQQRESAEAILKQLPG